LKTAGLLATGGCWLQFLFAEKVTALKQQIFLKIFANSKQLAFTFMQAWPQ